MKVSHIEHLGVAVKSLDEAIPYWENVLGLKCYAIEEVADQKVRTAFFMLGQTKIELLDALLLNLIHRKDGKQPVQPGLVEGERP